MFQATLFDRLNDFVVSFEKILKERSIINRENMNKNILIIIVLVVALGAGILIWQFWPTEEATIVEPVLDSGNELEGWLTYQDEESGIGFNYPDAWGLITFKSQEDHVVRFSASYESIYGIWYHMLSGNIFFIERGEFFDSPDDSWGEPGYQGVVKVIYPEGGEKTIYSDKRDDVVCHYSGPTRDIAISPDGNYFSISRRFSAFMMNVETTEKITDRVLLLESGTEYTSGLLFNESDVYWSPDNQVLAIRSHMEQYGGEGTEGLFVSDYGNPDALNGVYLHPMEKYRQGIHLRNVSFINNKEVYFEVASEKEEFFEKYVYNAETRELDEASKPSFRVISPKGGDNWKVGESYEIIWETEGLEGETARLVLGVHEEHAFFPIAEVPATLGRYSWTIPSDTPSGKYNISIRWPSDVPLGQVIVADKSDGYFTITAEEFADWQTYQSLKTGISIQYPPEMSVQWEGDDFVPACTGYRVHFGSVDKIKLPGGDKPALGIEIYSCIELGWVSSFQEWIDYGRADRYYVTEKTIEFYEENIILDDRGALKIYNAYSGSHLGDPDYKRLLVHIFVRNEKVAHEIRADIDLEKKDIYLPIFHQMLSTFRFLE